MTAPVTDAELDPLEPSFYADPHGVFARLRAEAPVRWHEPAELWTVARHADVMAVSRDPETFRSGEGVLLTDRQRGVSPVESIIFLDPPEHVRHRKLVSPAFTPRRIADLEPVVRRRARDLLDAVTPGEPVEFVDAVAAPLPILVIAEMLGIRGEDRDRFRVWSDAMIAAASEYSDATVANAAQLYGYFQGVIAERRESPRDDLISLLSHAEVDDELLSMEELLGFCMTLLVAGNETTRNLVAGGVRALAEHPDQMAAVVDDPARVAPAVEEMLRWVTPVMSFARTATCDVVLGGETIRAGDYVLMLYGSANRDEEVFGPTADRFHVVRDPNPHVAFGFGEHYCLGASLARLEARILLEEIVGRFAQVTLVGEPDRLPSVLMNGLVRLPVVFAA